MSTPETPLLNRCLSLATPHRCELVIEVRADQFADDGVWAEAWNGWYLKNPQHMAEQHGRRIVSSVTASLVFRYGILGPDENLNVAILVALNEAPDAVAHFFRGSIETGEIRFDPRPSMDIQAMLGGRVGR